MGVVFNYKVAQLKNFVCSFRRFNQTADVVLFTDQLDNELSVFFSQYNITPVIINTAQYPTNCNNYRYREYLTYILQNPQYKNIFTTDVRDVVFQSDPFANLYSDNYLYVFEEDASVPVSAEPWNSSWIRALYGQERLNEIANFTIICSGTILGSRDNMIRLIDLMGHEINRTTYYQPHIIADQGVLNHICNTHWYSIFNMTKKSNGDIVGTLHSTILDKNPSSYLCLDFNRKCVTLDGQIPAVIHQYDRNPVLQNFYDSIYPL